MTSSIHHSIEYITIQNPLCDLPIIKFFLDIYIDKFGLFIMQLLVTFITDWQYKIRISQELKNHFLIGFISFTITTDEVFQPFISDIQELECRYELNINN
ncbi:hypothetical protein C1646_750959 [Rhizophagus diaphanus]|nr:hypothetical protein C1646_750959 [Rhizophagus diaphanus] [Rhizophagus sp. MUCL 43196]